MDFKSKKGSITIFVLVGLLFMSAFLIISYGYNINKSKVAKEQFNIISDIYSYKDGDKNAYTRAYTALRKKNVQTFSFENEADANKTVFENTNTVELNKTFDGNLNKYRIYGNCVQDTTNGDPSPTNPLEIKSVGEKTNNLFDINQVKNSNIKVVNDTLEISAYANSVGIKPSKFLEMTGLKIGDTITTTRTFEFIKGKKYATGMVAFVPKATGVSTITLIDYNQNVATLTIPENFLDENFYGLYFYGAHEDENGESLTIFRDFQIIKGSYTEENVPEYEPYGKYKIPIKITNENGDSTIKNIYLDEPLRKVETTLKGKEAIYADYIDFASNTVVRNVSTINLSALSYTLQNQTVTGGYRAGYFSFPTSLSKKIMLRGTAQPGLSNVLPANTGNWSSFTTENIRFGQVNTAFYIYTLNSYESKEDLLSYLGNGDASLPYAIYPLATTILETIQLSELKTFEDYTKIEVLTEVPPSKIEVEYKGYTLD